MHYLHHKVLHAEPIIYSPHFPLYPLFRNYRYLPTTIAQVRKGLELVNNKKGTLIVIMRYTGDVLLFVSHFAPRPPSWPRFTAHWEALANRYAVMLSYTGSSKGAVCRHKPRTPSQDDSRKSRLVLAVLCFECRMLNMSDTLGR